MNTSPLAGLRRWLDDQQLTPVALVLALVGAFLTWLFFEGALLNPWADTNNDQAQAAALGFLGVIKFLLVAAPVVALWRPWPALALALPMVIWVLITSANVPLGLYVGLLAIAVTATFRSTRAALVGLVAALAPIAAVCAVWRSMAVPFGTIIDQQYADTGTNLALFGIYVLVSACLVGGAFLLRARALAARERDQLAASSRAVARDAAITEERARLARDLHDVVAHHVSLIAVRAETAPFQHPDLDESARTVLAEISSDARAAMDELRDVLGVLRRGDEAPATQPQPGAADIPDLVERARASGQQVDLEGSLPQLRASHGYAVYRLVQEALTNARRHAPGEPVSIHVSGGDAGRAEVTVLNRAPANSSASVAGRGLTGMRERIEALGGDLTATRVGEDFVVRAVIPSDSTADSDS